jgi:hypothetical protein
MEKEKEKAQTESMTMMSTMILVILTPTLPSKDLFLVAPNNILIQGVVAPVENILIQVIN